MTPDVPRQRTVTTAVVVALAVLVVALALGVGFLVLQNAQQGQAIQRQTDANTAAVARIQRERRDSLVRACESANAQSRANLRFLRLLHVPDAAIDVARSVYPIEPDCAAYADQRVGANP